MTEQHEGWSCEAKEVRTDGHYVCQTCDVVWKKGHWTVRNHGDHYFVESTAHWAPYVHSAATWDEVEAFVRAEGLTTENLIQELEEICQRCESGEPFDDVRMTLRVLCCEVQRRRTTLGESIPTPRCLGKAIYWEVVKRGLVEPVRRKQKGEHDSQPVV